MVPSKDMGPLPKNFAKTFFRNQFIVQIDLPASRSFPSLKGKVAVITGANCGLGFECAKQLLSLGLSHLVVAVRSLEKGEVAAKALATCNPAAEIMVWKLDMESYDEIQTFVARCQNELPRLDFAILNAGLAPLAFSTTGSTGNEKTIQVNHLSTALLAILLLPVLHSKSTSDDVPRLCVVNSLTAHLCKFPNRNERPLLKSFNDTNVLPYDAEERYGVSKLLSQLFLVELADRVSRDNVVVNMVDPGLTKGTALARDVSGIRGAAAKAFLSIAGRPVERGAATYVDALLAQGEESHGCFLMNNKISPLAGFYYTADGKVAQEQLWKETMEELSFANVKEIVTGMK